MRGTVSDIPNCGLAPASLRAARAGATLAPPDDIRAGNTHSVSFGRLLPAGCGFRPALRRCRRRQPNSMEHARQSFVDRRADLSRCGSRRDGAYRASSLAGPAAITQDRLSTGELGPPQPSLVTTAVFARDRGRRGSSADSKRGAATKRGAPIVVRVWPRRKPSRLRRPLRSPWPRPGPPWSRMRSSVPSVPDRPA